MKNYLLIGFMLTGFFVSCSSKKNKKAETVIPKVPGRVLTDSIAPPAVTMITEANAPTIIKAAPPVIVPLSHSSGVGVPGIDHYGIEEGLPQTNIRGTATDQQGNIWLATGAGISKYDGDGFTNYNSVNGMGSRFPRALFIDSKNNIWIGYRGGLGTFNGRYFTQLIKDEDLFPDMDKEILEDNNGSIWIGSGNGLYKYKDSILTKYTTADGLADKWVSSIIQDKNGNLLISGPVGITRYDGKSFTLYTDIPVNKSGRSPLLLYCDSKGNIWFNNESGELGKYDGKQIYLYSKKDRGADSSRFSNLSNVFLEDKKGNYWIGGFNEVTKFDGTRFIKYPIGDDMSSFLISALAEDAYGNIWVGTQRNGIFKISSSYLSRMEVPAGVAMGMGIDKFGNKWISSTEGLGKYNNDHISYYGNEQFRFGYPGLYIDHAGNKWFPAWYKKESSKCIVKFNDTVFTIFGKAQGNSVQSVTSISEDDSNNIWFTGIGGTMKFDGVSFTSYGAAQGFRTRGINSLLHDSKNNYWFSSGEGVYKYNGQNIVLYGTGDGLPNSFINDITEDPLGNIWLGTDGGAAKFDGNTFTNYGEIDGLSNSIGDVGYDSINKCIWFDTRIGLASLKMDQVNEKKPLFQHYNPRTGFNLSIPRNISIDKEGVIWVLSNGISRFDYKSIKDSKPIPLRIKNIKLDNKNISWNSVRNGAYPVGTKDSLAAVNEMALKFGRTFSDEDFSMTSDAFGKVNFDSIAGSDFIPVNLVLPIKNNNISFEFGTISPAFGKAVKYQYKLEGYDKNWSELSSKTEASFGNMSEGHYTFHVKALSPFESWSETSYSFTVLPPWWRTWWAYTLYALLFISGVFLFIRWRTKALQKEKIVLEEKVTSRTAELKESLENLKSTQSQLIQSEKMASLGELTAGIAHEIQNPLNFVNNFSDVNKELLVEMKDEMKKGNLDDANEIANDVIANEEKINHHGKRADAIVKGMLQHSRSSSGVKESTDINALCDEYLRLSYHGLRAKDKSFNAVMKTDFDESIGNINIIPQDIGRVVLNLLTNAFYAAPLPPEGGFQDPAYKHSPTVWLTTKKVGDKVFISVKDNGPGIPKKILDKIFQPFFTTKPTGQGTGLGLSLSYDIIKAHGGEINVNTKENEGLSAEASAQAGTEFTIQLPII